MNILEKKLERKVLELKDRGLDDTVIVNALKEYLQHVVLHFVYNSRGYNGLIMYGGSCLRICYGLDRMSEDLDFQTAKDLDTNRLLEDMSQYFQKNFHVQMRSKAKIGRSIATDLIVLKFDVLANLPMNISWKTLKLRFDVNHFSKASSFYTESIPVLFDNYTYAIRTYPLATLMASKIAGVLARKERGIGKETITCKPRDIYDLVWYMKRKIIPNLDYLRAKDIAVKSPSVLFQKIVAKIDTLDDKLFTKDLLQFFYESDEYETWFQNWRQMFAKLEETYVCDTVSKLAAIEVYENSATKVKNIRFFYSRVEQSEENVCFHFPLSSRWYRFVDLRIQEGHRIPDIEKKIQRGALRLTKWDYEYIGLLYEKIEDCLSRNDHMVMRDVIKTRTIGVLGEGGDVKDIIHLNRKLLSSVTLEDLL